jgi:hypothetical protein
LIALDPERIANVLVAAPDAAELLSELRSALALGAEHADSYRRLAASARDARVAPLIADALADAAPLVNDPEVLALLERAATSDAARTGWASALADELAKKGAPGAAALARARLAAHARDSASLRAALSAAERAGDIDAALAIVDLALSVVGDSPARSSLEATRARLTKARDE